jgi:hypothetical protein
MPLLLLLEVGCFEDTDLSPSSAATSGDTGSSTSSSGGTASTTIDASTDTSAGATSDEPSAAAGTSLTDPGSSGTSDGSSSTGTNTQTSAETLDTTTSTSEPSTSMVSDLPAPMLLPVYALCFDDSECESGWCLAPDNKTRGTCSVGCSERGTNSPDCPDPPVTGAANFCLDDLANGALGCVLNCSDGFVCPDDLVCADEIFNGNIVIGICL